MSVDVVARPHGIGDVCEREWRQIRCEQDAASGFVSDESAWNFTSLLSARSTVRVVDDHTGQYGLVRRVDGDVPGTPWALNLADEQGRFWYLVLDFDAKNGHTAEQVSVQCEIVCEFLAEYGLSYTVCESGQSGGRHVWIGLSESVDVVTARKFALAARVFAPSIDIAPMSNAVTGCVRPPYAPHKDGLQRSLPLTSVDGLLMPTNTAAMVERFVDTFYVVRTEDSAPDTPVTVLVDPDRRHSELPQDVQELLRTGHASDKSKGLHRIIMGALAHGWNEDQIVELLPYEGMISARTHNRGAGRRVARRDPEGYLRSKIRWFSANVKIKRVRSNTRHVDYKPLITQYVSTVVIPRLNDGWFSQRRGRGAAALRVYARLAILTAQIGTFRIGASLRDLALATGMTHTTVADCLRLLERKGYIWKVKDSHGIHSTIWSVREETAFQSLETELLAQNLTQGLVKPAGGVGGLSLTALDGLLQVSTHDAFFGNPYWANKYGLQATLGQDMNTVLGAWDTRFRLLSLDEIAVCKGTVGVLAGLAAQYELDRLVFAWLMDEIAFLKRGSDVSRVWSERHQMNVRVKRVKPVRGRFPRRGKTLDWGTAADLIQTWAGASL